METVEVGPPLRKRPRLDGCLCHCRNVTGKLTCFTDASWETFRRSAEVRRDDAYEVLSQHFSAGGGPFGGYHRSCYQAFTNKTLLARLQRDESKAESENNEGDASPTCDDRSLGSNDADPHPITIRRRSGVPSTDFKECIICQGEKTFVHK